MSVRIATTARRSKGYGAGLLSWLKEQAAEEGCEQMPWIRGSKEKTLTDSMRVKA